MTAAYVAAEDGPLRALVHCAGADGAARLVERDASSGSLETYTKVITLNLIGSFNVLRLAAASMAANDPLDGDRGRPFSPHRRRRSRGRSVRFPTPRQRQASLG